MPFSATGHPTPTSLDLPEGPSQLPDHHWEEPHPGYRLPGVTERTPPSWGQRHTGAGVTGEFRNGMAAKGYHDLRVHRYRIQRPFMVRRDVRIRRHPKVSARRSEAHDVKNDGPGCGSVTVAPLPKTTAEAYPRDSTDGDGDAATITDTGTDVEVATVVTEQTLVPPSQRTRCTLGDVSNLLGIYEGDDDDDDRPATALNPDQLRPGPCEDMYGWEAELEQKMSADEHRKDTPGFHSFATSVRRSNQGARKLIHRVFSMGPSAAGEFHPGRRASTAN